MRTFTTAQSCKKKTLFLITLDILHSCCDFHKLNCNCESCIENTIVEEMGECSIEPPAKEISANSLSTCLVPVTPDQQDEIRSELEAYRASLQFGKLSYFGCCTLIHKLVYITINLLLFCLLYLVFFLLSFSSTRIV